MKCLVATNVAARGLDIPEIDLVVQTSPPSVSSFYSVFAKIQRNRWLSFWVGLRFVDKQFGTM